MADGGRTAPAIAIVGLGRVGSALALALADGTSRGLVLWDRSSTVRQEARRLAPRALVVGAMREAFLSAGIVLVAIPDGALPALGPPAGCPPRIVAHTSGVLDPSALGRFAAAGHRAAAWHPLHSFAVRWDRVSLAGTVVAVEGDAAARRALGAIARSLGARPVGIAPGAKALYHAAAALTANHGLVLAHVATRWMVRAGLSPRDARAGLGALLASAAGNLARRGAKQGLTGPLRRGDVAAIQAHLAAIARLDPASSPVYIETARAAIAPPDPAVDLPEDVRARIAALLGGAPVTRRATSGQGGRISRKPASRR